MKEKLKQKKGITLIALVITTIVLLILAGVSIAMLTGSNGILSQAQRAKTETENAAQNETAILDQYNQYLNNVTGGGTTGGVSEPATDENGLYTNNSTINGETTGSAMNPIIPAGFKPADANGVTWGDGNSSPTEENVNKGLVIEDESGNQFVWVPVDDINDMAQCSTAGGNCKLELQGNILKCATHDSEDIVGKLYATNSGENFGTVNTTYNANSGLREPSIVTSYDTQYYSNAGFNSLSDMEEGLKEEYKKMATSVAENHGFYVGRYELGLEGEKPVVKNASINTGVTTADTDNSNTSMWYGLYSKCKEFAPEESENSVVSSMIWGSQYDTMMNWMQGLGENVTSINSSKQNNSHVTGSDQDDIMRNIYDLYACHYEWTIEADSSSLGNYRVIRGSASNMNPNSSPSYRCSSFPNGTGSHYSSRITLYVK